MQFWKHSYISDRHLDDKDTIWFYGKYKLLLKESLKCGVWRLCRGYGVLGSTAGPDVSLGSAFLSSSYIRSARTNTLSLTPDQWKTETVPTDWSSVGGWCKEADWESVQHLQRASKPLNKESSRWEIVYGWEKSRYGSKRQAKTRAGRGKVVDIAHKRKRRFVKPENGQDEIWERLAQLLWVWTDYVWGGYKQRNVQIKDVLPGKYTIFLTYRESQQAAQALWLTVLTGSHISNQCLSQIKTSRKASRRKWSGGVGGK